MTLFIIVGDHHTLIDTKTGKCRGLGAKDTRPLFVDEMCGKFHLTPHQEYERPFTELSHDSRVNYAYSDCRDRLDMPPEVRKHSRRVPQEFLFESAVALLV